MSLQDNYSVLLEKLDHFIRKYYKNQLLRGAIYTFTAFLLFYVALVVGEHYLRFGTGVRTFLFYGFIAFTGFILGRWIVIPLLKLNRLGKIISHEQAAAIIGKHFREVEDKLLNILQLRKQANSETATRSLIDASIRQKVQDLRPVPFSNAINLGENRRYLRYAIVPVLFLGIILFSAPDIITESTARLIEHHIHFERPAPFIFEIINKDLHAIQQEDYELKMRVSGKEIPANTYIEIEGNQYKLDKEGKTEFGYVFRNVQKNILFRFYADGFYSREYELVSLPSPTLLGFEIALTFPAYLGKNPETIINTGDLIIPAGTRAEWIFKTRNTDRITLAFADTSLRLSERPPNHFSGKRRFLRGNTYTVKASNEFLSSPDPISYSVTVIPDQYPEIRIEQEKDSLSDLRFFFKGNVRDDYGFSKLTFNYKSLEKGTSKGTAISEKIPVSTSQASDQFFYYWDMERLNLKAGDEIEYYFEIWDNDGVTGSKATRSQTLVFKAPTVEELEAGTKKNAENIKQDLKESVIEARKLQKELENFNKSLFEKKELNWEDRKKAESLISKQQSLMNKVNEISRQNEKDIRQQQTYNPEVNTELLEKQRQINELLDKLMSDEMKKMMEELEKLMSEIDKNKLQETLEKMKYDAKDMEKELDRSLEFFKQLELQQQLEKSIDKLNAIKEDQEKLSEKSLEKNVDSKELKEKQERLNQEFKELKQDLKELEEKNKGLENPHDLKNTDSQQNEIQQEMQESEQQLGNNNNKKASKSQKQAAQKMDQLSKELQQMQAEMNAQQAEEDIAALRDLLENLLKLSFDQEALMNDLKATDPSDPRFLKIARDQRKLRDDMRMIEDSLTALSKRVAEIRSMVNQEVNHINLNMDRAIRHMQDMGSPSEREVRGNRLREETRSRQQYVMTSVNNLALMLSEVLQAMQQQSAPSNAQCNKPGQSQQQKSGQCNKPGQNQNNAGQLRKMQEELNKQLQSLKEGMKPGGKTGQKGGMSEQLAKLAAQQEMIRNELQKLNQQENKDGKGSLGDLEKLAKEMEKTENDIVNKNITQETLMRQQEILTRLLEAEKAEREREMDPKRESSEGKDEINYNHFRFEEYKRSKLKETELLRTIPPNMNEFYRKKVNDYFQHIENQ